MELTAEPGVKSAICNLVILHSFPIANENGKILFIKSFLIIFSLNKFIFEYSGSKA